MSSLDDQLYDYLAAGTHGLSLEVIAHEFGDIPWDELGPALDRLINDGRITVVDDYYYIEGVNESSSPATLYVRPEVEKLVTLTAIKEVVGDGADRLLAVDGWIERYSDSIYMLCAPLGDGVSYSERFKSINNAFEMTPEEKLDHFLMMLERYKAMHEKAVMEMNMDKVRALADMVLEGFAGKKGFVKSTLESEIFPHISRDELDEALGYLVGTGELRRVYDIYFVPGTMSEIEARHFPDG